VEQVQQQLHLAVAAVQVEMVMVQAQVHHLELLEQQVQLHQDLHLTTVLPEHLET
jgi:hypothetical protein